MSEVIGCSVVPGGQRDGEIGNLTLATTTVVRGRIRSRVFPRGAERNQPVRQGRAKSWRRRVAMHAPSPSSPSHRGAAAGAMGRWSHRCATAANIHQENRRAISS
jgi:hypothetical protein